jgi:polyphosphate kinase 2 (PPK2 family)
MAEEDAGRQLANAKKRRGVARASLTRLSNRLKDLEGEAGEPKMLELARRMSQKLVDLDSEFRAHHHALIDLMDDDDSLAKEQDVLDSHDDLVAELGVRVKQVIAVSSPSTVDSSRRITSRKFAHLQKSLSAIIIIDRR